MLTYLFASVACSGGGDGGTNPPPPPTVANVAVSLAAASITVGQTTAATAVARDAQGTSIAGKTATWSSSATAVATVDANGIVSGVSAGSSEIVATIDGRTGSARLTVTPTPVASVTVTLNSATIGVGQTTQAAAVLRDAAGNVLTGRAVAWASSNAAVATVSPSGLVSGVSAGSANITATSEGRTGQAATTVTQVVSVSGLVLLNANGQPLDTTNVAGTITLSFDQLVPSGFRGVLEVSVGGVVFSRDSVTGTSLTSSRAASTSLSTRTLQTGAIASTYTNNQLRSIALKTNGLTSISVGLLGMLPSGQQVSSSVQRSLTLNNPDGIRLYGRSQRFTVINGRPVMSGDIDFVVEDIAYSGQPVNQIEVIVAPYAAQFSSGASAGGAITIATRSAGAISTGFTVSGATLPFERANRFALASYARGGQTFRLGDIPQTGGNTTAPDGTLLAGPPSGMLGGGLRHLAVPSIAPGVLPPGFQDLYGRTDIDNVLNAPAGVFTPLQGNTQVGQSIYATGTQTGGFANRFGRTHDFRSDVQYTRFNDASGIDPLKTTFRFGSITAGKNSWSTWTPGIQLPLTSTSYSLSADATFEDLAGNRATVDLQTNALNDITLSGSPGALNQPAAFSVSDAVGSVAYGGVQSPFVNNWPTVGSASRSVTASNVTMGFPGSPWGAWAVTVNGQRLFGFQNGNVIDPELYATTGSGTSGNASFPLTIWTSKAATTFGGDEGVYVGSFSYRDNSGQGLTPAPQQFFFVNDRTPPSKARLQVQGSFVPGGTYDLTAILSDNVGLDGFAWGYRVPRPDSRFEGGSFHAYRHRQSIGTGPTGAPVLSGSWMLGGTFPRSYTFADNNGGFAGAQPYGVDGIVGKSFDMGGNPGLAEFFVVALVGPAFLSTSPTSFQQLQSGPAACAGTSALCGSTPRTVMLDAGIIHTSVTPTFTATDVFGVHQTSKRVQYFGSSTSLQTTPLGGGLYRTFTFVPFDASRFGGEAGLYDLFSLGYTSNDDAFVSNFSGFTVTKGPPN